MCDLGTLNDGLEVEHFDSGTSAGSISERLNDGGVDGILILRTQGVSSKECLDSVETDGELVGSQNSEHGIVTPANSSMAVMRVTVALYLANC